MEKTIKNLPPGLYWWWRVKDETGISGAGVVGTACIHPDYSASFRWSSASGVKSWSIYDSVEDLMRIHGHGDKKTGVLVPVLAEGQLVQVDSLEGFGGIGRVLKIRENAPFDYFIEPLDGHQPKAYWAWGEEVRPGSQHSAGVREVPARNL